MSALFRLVFEASSYAQLVQALGDDATATYLLNPTNLPNQQKEVCLSQQQAEAILNALGDLLCTTGTANGEINAYGRWLEPLIDLVNEQPLC